MSQASKQTGIRKNSKDMLANVMNSNQNSNISIHNAYENRKYRQANQGKLHNEQTNLHVNVHSNVHSNVNSVDVNVGDKKRQYGTSLSYQQPAGNKYGESRVTSKQVGKLTQIGRKTDRQFLPKPPTDRHPHHQTQSIFSQSSPHRNPHLPTQQLIPSFREQYQHNELIQQISDTKRTLQMKNKQIFYLSNQIVSIKDEYTQKIIQLQNIINENKKQITELRYSALKNKRVESDKFEKIVEECKKGYELQLRSLKDGHQQLMKKMEEQHKQEIKNMEQKLQSLIKLQKNEKSTTLQLSTQKQKNYEQLITQLQTQVTKLYKERQKQSQNMKNQQNNVQKLKEEFKNFGDKATNMQKNLRLQIQKLSTKQRIFEQENTKLKKDIQSQKSKYEHQSQQQKQQLILLKQQSVKLKQMLTSKDKQISKLLNTAPTTSMNKQNTSTLELVRPCNHQGLIRQLQKNIELKSKENAELCQQLQQWGRYIGFERGIQERSEELLNASLQALSVQQSFSSGLRKRMAKYS